MKRVGCIAILSAVWGVTAARADWEPPNPAYAPPTNYYTSAIGTSLTLRANLHTIISTGFVGRSYGDSRYAMGTGDSSGSPATGAGEDLDPNNPNNILLVYNDASIPAKWDAGDTWNREHVWPKFLLGLSPSQNGGKTIVTNTYVGVGSDAFELLPADPNVNSARLDSGYGFYPLTGTGGTTHYGSVSSGGTTYWYPGDADRGDVARVIFYMATRYFDPNNSQRGTSAANLQIVNGAPSLFNFGDLNSLLHWNYQDGVSNFERRRNQIIYGSSGDSANHALNPSYYQGNRNPFVDHPEYVWAVFGTTANNSQLTVASNGGSSGASTANVDLGRAIVGAASTAVAGTFTITKNSPAVSPSTLTPTTYDLTAGGAVTSAVAGTGNTFDYGNQTRVVPVTLASGATATVGVKSGTFTVNNTDLTSAGAGMGSADGDDLVNVTATIVDHATPSFSSGSIVTGTSIDFGYVPQGFANRTAGFSVSNLQAASGFTAGLAVTGISNTGSTGVLSTNATTFGSLTAGLSTQLSATLNPNAAGAANLVQTLATADEAIPGATALTSLGVTMSARVLATGAASFPVTGTIQLNSSETYNTGTATIGAGVTVTKTGAGAMNFTGVQSHGAGSTLIVNAGPVRFDADAGAPGALKLAVSASGVGSAVTFNSTEHLASLSIAAGASGGVMSGKDTVLVVNSLSLNDGTSLDLTDESLVVYYQTPSTPIGQIAQWIATAARGSGLTDLRPLWSGPGLTSSTAHDIANHITPGVATGLGYEEASIYQQRSGPMFGSENLTGDAVLVKYTYLGDANLDGVVDDADVDALITNYGKGAGQSWMNGDFNYDGVVDNRDVDALSATIGQSDDPDLEITPAGAAKLAALIDGTAVPEPGSISVVLAGVALLRRRRR